MRRVRRRTVRTELVVVSLDREYAPEVPLDRRTVPGRGRPMALAVLLGYFEKAKRSTAATAEQSPTGPVTFGFRRASYRGSAPHRRTPSGVLEAAHRRARRSVVRFPGNRSAVGVILAAGALCSSRSFPVAHSVRHDVSLTCVRETAAKAPGQGFEPEQDGHLPSVGAATCRVQILLSRFAVRVMLAAKSAGTGI